MGKAVNGPLLKGVPGDAGGVFKVSPLFRRLNLDFLPAVSQSIISLQRKEDQGDESRE
jgi:hypothetical protein